MNKVHIEEKPLPHYASAFSAVSEVLAKFERIYAGRVPWWCPGDAERPARTHWKQESDEFGLIYLCAVTLPHYAGRLVTVSVRAVPVQDLLVQRAYLPQRATLHRPDHTKLEFRYFPNGLQLVNHEVCHPGDFTPEWIAEARTFPSMTETRQRYHAQAAAQLQLA